MRSFIFTSNSEKTFMENQEKNSTLFFQLVYSLQVAGMQQLGKIKNPLTDKIERNLQEAELTIDMLEMLHTKTQGNISDDEEKILSAMLQDLKLNYVDEKAKGESS
jgi:hypothetical protein